MTTTPDHELGSGNVFADIGLPDAETHLLKAQLVSRIQDVLDGRKLSQTQLAEPLGWKQKKISLIEGGKQSVHLGEIEQISDVLGKDPVAMIAEAFKRYRGSKPE